MISEMESSKVTLQS
jgi:hypothetical protein